MNTFLTSNKTSWRLTRTIIQGIIGVVIANIDIIIGVWNFSPETKALIVALTMAILSPLMGPISSNGEVIEAYGGETNGDTVSEHETNDPEDSTEGEV